MLVIISNLAMSISKSTFAIVPQGGKKYGSTLETMVKWCTCLVVWEKGTIVLTPMSNMSSLCVSSLIHAFVESNTHVFCTCCLMMKSCLTSLLNVDAPFSLGDYLACTLMNSRHIFGRVWQGFFIFIKHEVVILLYIGDVVLLSK